MLTAEATPSNFAFKLQYNDAPSGGTPSTRMFISLVSGTEEQYSGANDEKKISITLEVNSNIVHVNAAAGED